MAGTDISIYSNLLRPPKSVAEYDAEALSNQQNRLALQMSQAQLSDRQRAIDEGNKLRQVVSGFGADKSANANALLSAGLLDKAQAYQKSNADIEKASTDVEKTKQETLKMQKDSAAHQFEIAGQLASAWATNTAITKAQIQAGLSAAAHSGVISPEITQAKMTELENLPDNPMALNGWAKGTLQQVMKAKDSMSYIAPDANTVSNNATSVQTAGISAAASKYSADKNAATSAARLAYDKEKDAGSEDAILGPIETRMIAQQYLAGDNGALGNIGRGTQGSKNIVAVRKEVARQANAAGMNGADIAAKIAEFGGIKAGNRTLGTRTANIEVAAAEAAELAPLALAASAKVSRSGILPFGKAQIMFDGNTNDPDLREFAMANNALVNAFGQVMSRGGAATVSDKEHARELLSTAFDQPSYARAVGQLNKEIEAARRAPGKVRKEMSNAASGREGDHSTPAAGGIPSGWSVKEN